MRNILNVSPALLLHNFWNRKKYPLDLLMVESNTIIIFECFHTLHSLNEHIHIILKLKARTVMYLHYIQQNETNMSIMILETHKQYFGIQVNHNSLKREYSHV